MLTALLALVPPESPTAKILGGVAVGLAAIGALVFTVQHFRKGGSVSGLIKKVEAQKGAIQQAANLLPINDAEKQKLNAAINDPTSLLPPEAQQAISVVENANVYKQQAINALPLSDTQKAAVTKTVNTLQAQAVQRVQQVPIGADLLSLIQPASALSPPPPSPPEVLPPQAPEPVHIAINPEDIAAVQAFLDAKKKATQSGSA